MIALFNVPCRKFCRMGYRMHMVPDHLHSLRVNSVYEADCSRTKIDDISVLVHSRVLLAADFVALKCTISTHNSLLWLVLISFIYGLFDVAVIVSDDIMSNPVRIGTPGCRNICFIFYHRRLDILSVTFLHVFQLKFWFDFLSFPILATCPAYLFLICSQPWLRNCILDGKLWYEIVLCPIYQVDWFWII